MTNCLPISSTFSKDSRFFGVGFTPTAVLEAYGASFLGDDGRWYLDYVSGLGANLLGYAHPGMTAHLQDVLTRGTSYSLPSVLEQQVADKLVDVLGSRVPGWSPDTLGVRFGKTGSDACSMAIRLARAVTGRTRILSCGFHGWHDPFISATPPAWGVWPEQGVEAWEPGDDFLRGTAAIIIEPPMDPLPREFWQQLRRQCDAHGAPLILDEVVTFPRWSRGGAADYYGIQPDICCYSKGLGNGVAVSAIVGRREYFDWFSRNDPVFASSTFFGETLGLAAADYVLTHFTDEDVRHIWRIGEALMAGLREAGYSVVGEPPRFLVQFATNAERGFFILRMRDAQILWNRPVLPSVAHQMSDVGTALEVARTIKEEMSKVDVATVMKDRLPLVLFESR